MKSIRAIALFMIMIFVPFFLSLYYVNILSEILILGIFALSLNLLVGQTGLVSLGHAAFFGAGAYAAGLASIHLHSNVFFTMIVGMIIASLLAVIIGFVSTKAHGFYFLMLTLACSQMFYSFVYQWTDFTGGSNGLSGIPIPEVIGAFALSNQVYIYYFVLLIFSLVMIFLNKFLTSPLGQTFIGIKENEQRMKSIGYNTVLYKNISFIIAGTLGGLSGSLYVIFNSFISPADIYWTMSGSVLIMVLIGGAGTLWGPVIGAAFIVILETLISSYTENWMMIIGLTFILFVMFAPNGITGIFASKTSKLFSIKKKEILPQVKQETKLGR